MKSTSLHTTMTLADCFIFIIYGNLRSATDFFSFQKMASPKIPVWKINFLVLFLIFAESWDSWELTRQLNSFPASLLSCWSLSNWISRRAFWNFAEETETHWSPTEEKNLHLEFPFSHFLMVQKKIVQFKNFQETFLHSSGTIQWNLEFLFGEFEFPC